MLQKLSLSIIILAISIAGFIHLYLTRPVSQPVTIKEQTWIVTTTKIKPTTLSPTVTLYGKVESPRSATLRAPSISLNNLLTIKEVLILEGEKVTKGQALIKLDNADSQLNLRQREADIADLQASIDLENQRHNNDVNSIEKEEKLLSLIQKSLERAKKLEKQKLASEASLEESQQLVEKQELSVSNRRSEIKSHKARLAQYQARLDRAISLRDAAKLELERLTITAPFDGLITQVPISIGDRISSGSILITLYDTTRLEIRAQIPNRYQEEVLTALQNKQTLSATIQWLGQTIQLQLDRVAGQINANSGGIDGLFQIKIGKEMLRLGQFLSLTLQLSEQQNVIVLPFEAIYGTNRIYRLVDERMQGLTIESIGNYISPTGESQILVHSEQLKLDDEVIITQLPNAMDGLNVHASNTSK